MVKEGWTFFQHAKKLGDVHLWDGLDASYLYKASATLTESGDQAKSRFGCRTIEIDSEKGFF
ncbi:hypothetical protein [Marinilactibacillus kalidii]|uniref:hypothetical protein n=1 Tax=Marinilactibacillus kalidii TaxID=2820274 RepID=UPI001ABDFE16|nr:hypothetical protein [Marinilactibacillus kalidii]